MQAADQQRAIAAVTASARQLGLTVDDAVVLNNSNRLVVRLLPCDTVARIAPPIHQWSAVYEVELARRLADTDSPIGTLDARVEPRVVERDGFEIAFWTHHELHPRRALPTAEYAHALGDLHAGLRQVAMDAPNFTERITATRRDIVNRDATPDLTDADRALLADTLVELRASIVSWGAPEQLLHGEPHPGNVLDTRDGLLLIDFENTTYGPVEYDLAWVPRAVSDAYPNVDQDLVGECRGLVAAMITMHRWHVVDEHPSGRAGGVAYLDAVRKGRPWPTNDEIVW